MVASAPRCSRSATMRPSAEFKHSNIQTFQTFQIFQTVKPSHINSITRLIQTFEHSNNQSPASAHISKKHVYIHTYNTHLHLAAASCSGVPPSPPLVPSIAAPCSNSNDTREAEPDCTAHLIDIQVPIETSQGLSIPKMGGCICIYILSVYIHVYIYIGATPIWTTYMYTLHT